MRVDFGRLFLIDGIILAAGGLLAWAVFHDSTGRRAIVRIAFYTLVVAPVATVICLGIVLTRNIRYDVGQRAAGNTKRFDPSIGTLPPSHEELLRSKASPYETLITYLAKQQPVTVDIPGHGIAKFPSKMSSNEIAAVIKKNLFSSELSDEEVFGIAPDDLKKITLFDVAPDTIGYDFCAGFHGRVRNGLSRTIEQIGIKASFYNAAGQLIEVRTFWLTHGQGAGQSGSVSPNSPVSFEDLANVRVNHLPYGWKDQLEVIEAHYVKEIFDQIAR